MSDKSKSCCLLGRRGDIGAINAALRAGMPVRDVAKLYGVGKSSVGDHRRDCLRLDDPRPRKGDEPAPVEPPPTPPKPATNGAAVIQEPPDEKALPAEQRVPVDVLDEVRTEAAADTSPCPPDKSTAVRGVSEMSVNHLAAPSDIPRARPPMAPKDAKTFLDQALVCADIIATGKWEGRPTVRWLAALWGLSVEAVRDRHQAGTVAAAADRGQIEAERQVSIGALQEQERIALEAFEASKGIVDEEGALLFTAGDAKFLAVAQKARADIARIAGCVPSGTTVNVAVIETPQFATALDAGVSNVLTALQEHDEIARLSGLPRGDVAKVTAAVLQMVARKRLPALDVTGEERP